MDQTRTASSVQKMLEYSETHMCVEHLIFQLEKSVPAYSKLQILKFRRKQGSFLARVCGGLNLLLLKMAAWLEKVGNADVFFAMVYDQPTDDPTTPFEDDSPTWN